MQLNFESFAWISNSPISIYYGVDWVAMTLTLLAIYYIWNKSKYGFVLMILGNIAWIALGFLSQSLAMILANVLFAAMNVRAIYLWTEDNNA
jgi:hypothetical protein